MKILEIDSVKVKIQKKRIKNIYLRVVENEVIISAPFWVNEGYLIDFVSRKSKWIKSKIKPKSDFEFFGKSYKLKAKKAKSFNITFFEEFVEVEYKKDLKKELQIWQKKKAKEIFNEIIEKYAKEIGEYPKRVTIRKARTRWGSCNHKKRYINLNIELLKKPIDAIEYVILHELTHLIYPNHSKEFYAFIKKHMPDFKKREKLLKN
jgi:predicted metal-dependent hydrolase